MDQAIKRSRENRMITVDFQDQSTTLQHQRRVKNADQCGVEVAGGRVPTSDWMLSLQILTSGGYQCAVETPYH